MPAADDFHEIDNFDEPPPATTLPPSAQNGEDPWEFDTSNSPPKSKKNKNKNKHKKNAVKAQQNNEDEDLSRHTTSITPSPPNDHGVKLEATPPSPAEKLREPEPEPEPLVTLDDEEKPDVEVAEPEPHYKYASNAARVPSPAVRSPRPTAAKPVPVANPPSRPVSFYGGARDRRPSINYRSTAPGAQPMHTRRESFAQPSPRPRLVEPPPPHMPQAHFFGLPDLGLFGQKQEMGRPAGSDGYCCRLDSFADAGDEGSATKARDALLVGSEGGLEVFRILPNKLEVVGRLEGLRGAVIGAKILPHTDKFDFLQELRPLIALVIHGPYVEDRRYPVPEDDAVGSLENDPPTHFQTTVDVYSLQSQHFITPLWSSPAVAMGQPILGQVSSLPDPVGDIEVDAKGRFITVSSGQSGEIWVFTETPNGELREPQYRCLGKFWTTIQKPLSARPLSQGPDPTTANESKEEPRKPIYSLSPRWLAIAPPNSTSSISIQGVPLTNNFNPNPPGIATHAAPPQPVITCEVAGTDTEGTWSRLGRQAAQGLVKYSQKGIEMGWQGWKELTQPSPPSGRQPSERGTSKEDLFPPTKAPSDDPTRFAKEPALVSIIDLDSLLVWEEQKPKYLASPMATFALVDGCNYLSLSSTGIKLLTSSRKGDFSTVWDLSQVAHGVPRRLDYGEEDVSTTPCIKQLLRIARNSPSTILDCAWSKDDDAIAVLTTHGTVHLHQVPARPPSRKRKRKVATSPPAPEKADATVSLSTGLSPPSSNQGFMGTFKSWSQSVSTQVSSIRSTNPASALGSLTTFQGFRTATAAAGNAGSRAVARSLSQGLTAAKGGAIDYWHADDNKIRHTKAMQEPRAAKSLVWVRRNNTTSVAIACGGQVHIHPVQLVTRAQGDAMVTGFKHEKYAHKAFPLPPITTRSDAGGLGGSKPNSCNGQGPHGFWSLRHATPPEHRPRTLPHRVTIAMTNDVETNPPYCPFHIDSRVSIYAFDEMDQSQCRVPAALEKFQSQGHDDDDGQPWAFGGPLPPSSKVNEHTPDHFRSSTTDSHNSTLEDSNEEEDVADQMESKLTIQPSRTGKKHDEQIRVNTRRRLAKSKTGRNPDADFSMEDEDGFI